MIETLSISNRRTLNFPAIQPSEEVSPPTLLDSLVDLAGKVCSYKSKFFASNDRNARESIRQVGVLLVFLEEIRGSSLLPDGCGAVVLSLSELHVVLQKLRWLLEDCSRDGARFLMLAKSELVAGEFRSFMRSVSTAMDVFPTNRINIDMELREQVELAMKQARESKFDVDSNDERVLQIVRCVLFGFENNVIPDRNAIIQVLDYLRIKSWSKCHREAKFLESETEFEEMTETSSSLLSSLTGLASYCRCTAFSAVDDGGESLRRPSRERRSGYFSLAGVNENDFLCPISLEIMKDPVTIASGQSYDRASIAKWFKAGNFTCPKTGEKLPNTEMVPNPTLRKLIHLYCSENGLEISDPIRGMRNRRAKKEVFNFPSSSAAERAMKLSANFLTKALENGTEEEKNKAAYEIRILSKTSGFNRACLVESGAVQPLLSLSLAGDSSGQENSAAALLNLSKCSEARESIGFEAIVEVLKNGLSLEARQHAAGVLFYLASTEDRRASMGKNLETIPGLIELVKNGTELGKKNALVTIFALLANQGNHGPVVAAGTIPILVGFLFSKESEELVADSLAILSILSEELEGTKAILSNGALGPAIRILNCSDSRSAKEHCVSLLLGLSKNRENEVVSVLVKSDSLMKSLYCLVSQGTSRASKKASALIRVIHDFYEQTAFGLSAPVLSHERLIRAW